MRWQAELGANPHHSGHVVDSAHVPSAQMSANLAEHAGGAQPPGIGRDPDVHVSQQHEQYGLSHTARHQPFADDRQATDQEFWEAGGYSSTQPVLGRTGLQHSAATPQVPRWTNNRR